MIERAAIVLVATAPVVVGGTWPPGQALWSLMALGLLFASGAVSLVARARWRWEPIAVVLGAVAVLTLVRATSLGRVFGGQLEAGVFALWPDMAPRGSVAPGRAPLAALRLLGIAAIVQLWAVQFRGRGGTDKTARAVLGAVAIAVVLGIVHRGLALDRVLGVFQPTEMVGLRSSLAAPFVNENQAGALWSLGGVLAVGIAWTRRRGRAAAAAVGVALILASGLVLHAHAAAAAAVVALLFLVAISSTPLAGSGRWATTTTAAACAVVVSSAVVGWFVLPSVPNDVVAAKAQVWRDTLDAVVLRPFGYGPGAFPDAFGAFSSAPDGLRTTWVESQPLQVAVDHGWLVLVVVVIACAGVLLRRMRSERRGERHARAIAAAVAVFLGCEAVGGMGLQALGYAFPTAALLGLAAARGRRRTESTTSRRLAIGLAVGCAVTIATLPGLTASTALGSEHLGARLRVAQSELGVGTPEFESALVEAASVAPGDPVLISYAADHALAVGDVPRARALVDHLVRYAPGRWVTWAIAADVAAAEGDPEAVCSAAAELVTTAGDPRRLTRVLRRASDDPRTWLDCVPGATARTAILDGLRLDGRSVEALAVAMRVLREHPDDVGALAAALEGAIELGTPDLAVPWGVRLLELEPANLRAAILTARASASAGDHALALEILDAASARAPAEVAIALERLAVLASWRDPPDPDALRARFDEEYGRLLPRVSTRRPDAVRRLRIGGAFYLSVGDTGSAEAAYRALLRQIPDDPSAQVALQRIAAGRRPDSTR